MKSKELLALSLATGLVFGGAISCMGETGEPLEGGEPEPDVTVVAAAPEPPLEVVEPEVAPVEIPAVEIPAVEPVAPEPRTSVSVAAMMAKLHRATRVTSAPSFYPGALSTDPEEERRVFASRYRPTWPEENNLRYDQELFDVTVLVFSRLCVSEANWIHNPCEPGELACDPGPDHNRAELDCPAIYRVIRRTRGRGETLIGAMRRHTHYVTEQWAPRGSRTRWIVNLNLENRRPEHFPASLNWERDYLPRWQAVQALTRRLLAGHDLGPCASAPIIAWGGRCEDAHGACDDHIAERRGLVPYDCGDTANRFWCRPRDAGCVAPPAVADTTPTTEPGPLEEPSVETMREPPVAIEGPELGEPVNPAS